MKNKHTLPELGRMTEDQARAFLEQIRWPNEVACPHCGDTAVTRLTDAPRPGLFQCNGCRGQFTVTVGTIFEDSHVPLQKWVLAFALMCSAKKGISALQLQRNLGLGSYKSAWHMAHRIRHAMDNGPLGSKLRGTVEVDETYVGGRTREGKTGRGSERKIPVMVLVERGGKGRARSRVLDRVTKATVQGAMLEMIHRSATINTDEGTHYIGVGHEFKGGRKHVTHSKKEYAKSGVTTNTAESFFALLKRGIHGTFHHISKKHLHRYTNEFSFRWDRRSVDDGTRMIAALKASDGKRLMYGGMTSSS